MRICRTDNGFARKFCKNIYCVKGALDGSPIYIDKLRRTTKIAEVMASFFGSVIIVIFNFFTRITQYPD